MSFYDNVMKRRARGTPAIELHVRRASVANESLARPGFARSHSFAQRIEEYRALCRSAAQCKLIASEESEEPEKGKTQSGAECRE